MAKLIKDLYAVREGKVYPETFEKGSECPTDLEHVALELGYIEKLPREVKAIRNAPENKAIRNAPENKKVK